LANEIRTGTISTETPEFIEAERAVKDRISHFLENKGSKSVDHFHKRLGKIMWDHVGMARDEKGLKLAISEIQSLREEFWKDVFVPGKSSGLNPELDKAGRVADFLELGELMALDALSRTESCGGHFREESRTEEGEALRDDTNFAFVSAWEWTGDASKSALHKEALEFNEIELKQRSYK
jgi:succinate dehydrogenase / fumarate reductase flavoprotein subunit